MFWLIGVGLMLIIWGMKMLNTTIYVAGSGFGFLSSPVEKSKLFKTAKKGMSIAYKSLYNISIMALTLVKNLFFLIGGFSVVLQVIFLIVIASSVGGFMSFFTLADGDGFSLGMNDNMLAPFSSSIDASNSVKSNGSSGISAPPGITEESWNDGDDIGRRIAALASDSILNPPGGKYMTYVYGGRSAHRLDCSGFVCGAVYGATGYTIYGKKPESGDFVYNFDKNGTGDLEKVSGYATTYYIITQGQSTKAIVGKYSELKGKLHPGDIAVQHVASTQHTGIYVGRTEDNRDIFVHASGYKGFWSSIEKPKYVDLGIGFRESWSYSDAYIVRPSKLLPIKDSDLKDRDLDILYPSKGVNESSQHW